MSKTVRKKPPPAPSPKDAADLLTGLYGTASEFRGQIDDLEMALGMRLLGDLVGWKVLVLIHNKRTIRKYEGILGVDIREVFPEEGPLTHKFPAYAFLKKAGQFWKGVSGDIKVEDRREAV